MSEPLPRLLPLMVMGLPPVAGPVVGATDAIVPSAETRVTHN